MSAPNQGSSAARGRASGSAAIQTGLFGSDYGGYEVQGRTFLLSFLLHATVVLMLVASTRFVLVHRQEIKQQVISLVSTDIGKYLPDPLTKPGRGGGGGDLDKLPPTKGGLPKLAREQIAPPVVVLRNENPKLPVEPTIVAPPELKLPVAAQVGDPFQGISGVLSNGRGSGGGIGNGRGTGIGPGSGPGAGPGSGGGIYVAGGGVTAPRVLYDPDPEFSDEARKAKYQGTVLLWLIVGADGRAHDIKVARSLGMGLDEKAIAAVQTWRFEPGKLNGTPVSVQVNVAVNFRLY